MILAGMEHLQVVNLYRTRVTNSGVARLQGLKELTDVDLRYSRVTRNGVDSLRAALPDSKVQFAGSSTGAAEDRGSGPARPANTDQGDRRLGQGDGRQGGFRRGTVEGN